MNCFIEGLDPKIFPTIINITGSPLILSPNQVGISYKGDNPSINIGSVMQNFGPIIKNFRLTNTGPKEVEFGIYY